MTELALPLSIVLGLVIYTLVSRWYLWPWMRRVSLAEAVTPILLFHAFRYIGLAFLLPGVTAEALDPRFALPAAYGDLAAALLALAAALLLRRGSALAIPAVWLFSVVGLADMLNAVTQGWLHVPDPEFGATYFIPAVVVPALVTTHVLVIAALLDVRHRSPLSA
jgi:hypothetical protein